MGLKKIKLLSGEFVPEIGYGTYLEKGVDCYNGVLEALKAGYRHVDTAAFYGNEEEVGKAIRDSNVPREEIFVTTKVWNTDRGYEKAKKSLEESLERLGLDYVDLLLIHWPANEKQFPGKSNEINLDTWKAFIELYKEGKAKSIGVSNFYLHHLKNLINNSEITPMVDQIELHPGYMHEELLEFLKSHQIICEAWSPLGRGNLLTNQTVINLANKYNKTPAQILIKFILQIGAIPLVKSKNKLRIKENLDINDFEMSSEDLDILKRIDTGISYKNPDFIDF